MYVCACVTSITTAATATGSPLMQLQQAAAASEFSFSLAAPVRDWRQLFPQHLRGASEQTFERDVGRAVCDFLRTHACAVTLAVPSSILEGCGQEQARVVVNLPHSKLSPLTLLHCFRRDKL